jgi:hypothetical protein
LLLCLRRWYACRCIFTRSNLPVHFSLKNVYPPFLIDEQSPHPPLYAPLPLLLTFVYKDLSSQLSIQQILRMPGRICSSRSAHDNPRLTLSLHILGRNDVIVIEEWSNVLINNSTTTRVERRDGGVYSFHSSGSLSLLSINTLLSQVTSSPLKSIGGTSSVIICLIRSDLRVHPPQILVLNAPHRVVT